MYHSDFWLIPHIWITNENSLLFFFPDFFVSLPPPSCISFCREHLAPCSLAVLQDDKEGIIFDSYKRKKVQSALMTLGLPHQYNIPLKNALLPLETPAATHQGGGGCWSCSLQTLMSCMLFSMIMPMRYI